MKKPTKAQLDRLPSVSVGLERYVKLDALQELFDELEAAEQDEAKDAKQERASERKT